PRPTGDFDSSLVAANDSQDSSEPQAAAGEFSSEKRIEDFRFSGLIHSMTAVAHGEHDIRTGFDLVPQKSFGSLIADLFDPGRHGDRTPFGSDGFGAIHH